MNSDRRKRLQAIFEAATKLQGGERKRYLDTECAGDPALRAEVVQLFDLDETRQESLKGRVQSGGSVSSKQRLLELQTRIGTESRYEILGEFARGGMGAILRVWDRDLRRTLAMKVVLGQADAESNDGSSELDENTLGRFLEEAQVTGQLDHPGIVPVHELGLDTDRQVYFTMKLVKGRDLKAIFDLVKTGEEDWTQTRALGVLLKVCEAMSYAHSKKVIHRDLKPANIMVGPFGEVYVMDWGLAHVAGQQDTKDIRVRPAESASLSRVHSDRRDDATPDSPLLTMDGDVMGTPAFMSPEQARGEIEAMGPASDVYSLGGILYQLLAGHMPYVPPNAKVNAYAVWALTQQAPPTPIAQLAPQAPEELVAICEKAMERDPSQRYADMGAMAGDLQAFLEGRVVQAHRTGALIELRKWVSRNKALAATLAAALMLVVGGSTSWSLVLADKNEEIADLLEEAIDARDEAKVSAFEARSNATRADANATRADEEAEKARRKTVDVLRLSLSQDYEDLIVTAGKLWPLHPEKIGGLTGWIEDATKLQEELPALERKQAELRATAVPQTEEERQAERASHPDLGKLDPLRAEIEAKRFALAIRRGEVEVELPSVDWSSRPSGAVALRGEAWEFVKPDRDVFGKESLGLALVQRALDDTSEAELSTTLRVLAWAYFAVGEDEEVLDVNQAALESALEEDAEEAGRRYEELEAAVTAVAGVEGLAKADAVLMGLESELSALELRVNERQVWTFPAQEESETRARWWHNQISGLIGELRSLSAKGTGLLTAAGVSEEHGWSVARRLALAERLRDGFAEGGEFAVRWKRDMLAIQETYPGLELSMQLGLVPIGPDPASKLWEFWDVQSGTEPSRGEADKLVLEESSGLVFVLLPGGKFWMGAQGTDPEGQNYDKGAAPDESPFHEVELSAFFLSKYEMTQGQWLGLTGWNRSQYGPNGWSANWARGGSGGDLLQPVTDVSWVDCHALAGQWGLHLPSEAQWEYGCRGGSTGVYWSGSEVEDLQGVANIADSYAKASGAPSTWLFDEGFDDGYTVHAPVDALLPNGFGLHNVHGNVWEWCLDGYDGNFYSKSPALDPLNPIEGASFRVNRGGSFNDSAGSARSAGRISLNPAGAFNLLGLRPVRVITK